MPGWIGTWLLGLGTLTVLATALWLLSLRLRDVSIVDMAWGPFFLVMAIVARWRGGEASPAQLLHLVMVALWALRLAGHIGRRHSGEDPRYAAMRERRGERFRWSSLASVFLLQAGIASLLSACLLVVQVAPGASEGSVWELLGLTLWAVGFVFEAVADLQLQRFRDDPHRRGQVLDRGLWRYSRHPNYFGEALLWWGYGLFALGSPAGLWTLACPVVMTWLLLRVSGVTLLEKSLEGRKPAYRDYIERTSAFVPWFPRTAGSRQEGA